MLPLGLLAVLVVGLLARLTFATVAPTFLEGDSQSYLLPGWELAQRLGFSPELRRTPLYPLFIAGSFTLLGEDLQRLALAQHVLGLGTLALTYLIGRRLFGEAAGALAGLAVALSGPQLIYERYVMTEALFGFVLALACYAMVAASRRPVTDPPYRAALMAGLAIGLAALARPVAQAVLPIFLLALLALLPRWRVALRAAGLAVLGYALLVVPWTLRNLAAHDALSASGGLGRSLIARTVKYDTLFDWKWLSETYGGRDDLAARERMLLYRKRGNIPAGRSVRPYQDALMEELGLSQGEAERAMREIALEAIARRPLDYLRGSLLFTGQLLVGREEPLQSHWKQRANKDWGEQWDDRLDSLVGPLTPAQVQGMGTAQLLAGLYQPGRVSWLIVAFFLTGCAVALRDPRRQPALLLAAVALTLLALSAFLDGPVPRYRHPIEPLISVLGAGGLIVAVRALLGLLHGWRTHPRRPRDHSAVVAP